MASQTEAEATGLSVLGDRSATGCGVVCYR
jgi:hypothetical protein